MTCASRDIHGSGLGMQGVKITLDLVVALATKRHVEIAKNRL